MLIHSTVASQVASEYADFLSVCTNAAWYFSNRMGTTREDYQPYSIKLSSAAQKFGVSELIELAQVLEELFQKETVSDIDFQPVTDHLMAFINTEPQYRDLYIATRLEWEKKQMYGESFYNEIAPLLDAQKYDASTIAAFKFLDLVTQDVLSSLGGPSSLHGEDLINYAFSHDKGVLQLNAHLNEQKGLRNFFSGANALFRNPSAHRFVKFDAYTAYTIVSMVRMMISLVRRFNKKPQGQN